jgi:predicted RNase H-like HicB family nuclease
MNAEVVFEVTQDEDDGYVAECLTQPIVTQGDTWEELRTNVQEAVSAYFFDREVPKTVRIRLIRDEMLAVG